MFPRETISATGCAGLIRDAENVVALTGAGISTAAGIQDFRGPNGLYVTRQYDPEIVFDIAAFLPEHVGGDVVVVNKGEVGLQPRRGRYFVDADLDEFLGEVAHHLDSV